MLSRSPPRRTLRYVERLLEARVPEHLLHMMERPAGLQQAAGAFVAQIVEVQVDRLQRRPRAGARPVFCHSGSWPCAFSTHVSHARLRCPPAAPVRRRRRLAAGSPSPPGRSSPSSSTAASRAEIGRTRVSPSLAFSARIVSSPRSRFTSRHCKAQELATPAARLDRRDDEVLQPRPRRGQQAPLLARFHELAVLVKHIRRQPPIPLRDAWRA